MIVYPIPKKYTITVSKVATLSSTVKLFRFQFQEGVAFSFVPGQFVIVSHIVDGKEVKRSYSICSVPSDNAFVEVLVRRKDDGEMTPWLHHLAEGTTLEIQGPYGRFGIRDKERELVFIAAGAGIAPFRGVIMDYLQNNGQSPVTLLFGFRTEEDYFFKEEFENLAKTYKHFRLIPTASQPSPAWKGEKGRVTALFEKYLHPETNKDVYLCGPTPMVEDTVKALLALGFAKEQIFFERWG